MLAAGLGWGAAAQCDAGDELRRVLGVKGLEVERGASATVELVDALAHRRRPRPGLIVPVSPLCEVLDVFTRDEATHIDDDATTLKTSVAAVSDAVLQLELGGWLQALPGSRWTRVR